VGRLNSPWTWKYNTIQPGTAGQREARGRGERRAWILTPITHGDDLHTGERREKSVYCSLKSITCS